MRAASTAVMAIFLPLAASQCVKHGFVLGGSASECTFAALLQLFTPFFDDPVNRGPSCSSTAEQELIALLGAQNLADADTAIKAICTQGFKSYSSSVPFESIPGQLGSQDFIRKYFNGGTDWNEQRATLFPPGDEPGELSNLVCEDAEVIRDFYENQGSHGMVQWPDYLENFQCNMNAAYCCWPQDRQANDGNGNCEEPYDVNCIDKDPADNTDLCYVDLSHGASTTGFQASGEFVFQQDDEDPDEPSVGEGPVHCHGFAWTDELNDASAVYKANNLFYVSMFDHFYQRGYVREIPGAPMCACAEQMPVVSRSDCTEMAVQQSLRFRYENDTFAMSLEDIEIEFNSCEGINRRGEEENNDLWAYANRLYMEDRFSEADLVSLTTKLVGDDPSMCREAERRMMAQKGFGIGYDILQPGSWLKFAGRDALGENVPSLGRLSFRDIFASSTSKIIERACASCVPSHRHIFIRRLTPLPETLDLRLNLMHSHEQETGMVWNVDFTLHSTYQDALTGANPWICPDGYEYEEGFPGNCGPEGTVSDQSALWGWWNSRSDVAYFLEGTMAAFVPIEAAAVGEYSGSTAGKAYLSNGKLYLSSTGHDVGGERDGMLLYYNEHPADVDATVFVQDFHPAEEWSKACLVIKESLEPGSKANSVCVTGNYGFMAQQRDEVDSWTHYWGEEEGVSPRGVWLRLRKIGNTFTFLTSLDGVAWDPSLGSTQNAMTGESVIVGVAVCAGSWDGSSSEAIFVGFESEDFHWPSASPTQTPAPSTTNVVSTDIGEIYEELPGSASFAANSNLYTIQASGYGMDDSDSLHFVHFSRTGDFTMRVLVESIQPAPSDWSSAGLCVRESLAADAVNICALQSAQHGAYISYRNTTSAETQWEGIDWDISPQFAWVELQREGDLFTATRSYDGHSWDSFLTMEIVMSDAVSIGLVATAYTYWEMSGAVLRHYSVT